MRYLFLFLLLLVSQISWCQSVEFYREDLVFSLDSTYFTVNGTYYFRNNSDKPCSLSIAYPVPGIGFKQTVDTLVIYNIDTPEIPVKVIHKDTLYFFSLEIDAGGRKAYSISYRQKHNDHYARYILTSTSYWGKPLEEVNYDLLVPGYLHVDKFSYDPDTFTAFQGDTIFHWKKKDFMPDKDFVILFSQIY